MDDDRLSILSTMYTKSGDDTTILDSSTVPTYEEFSRKTINKNLITKVRNLNSTHYNEASSLMTDDESDEDDEKSIVFRKPVITTEKLCTALKQIQIQPNSPSINQNKFSFLHQLRTKQTIDEEYVQLAHKQVQTSFTNYETNVIESTSSNDENFGLHLSKSPTQDIEVIGDTFIVESSPEVNDNKENNGPSSFLTTPLRLTQKSSICPKSLTVTSPKLLRLSESPQIMTTYEKVKVNEKNVVVINHQLVNNNERIKKSRKRVSMCLDDVPTEIVEQTLDEDENRLDVTRGNIMTLESIYENENEIKNHDENKTKKKISSDSESNDEAFERFLQKHRQEKKLDEEKRLNDRKLMNNFIVDADYESSSSICSFSDDKISHESTRSSSTEGDDKHLFYIKATKKMSRVVKERGVNEKPSFTIHRRPRIELSTTSSSESSSEVEEEEIVVSDESPVNYKSPIKSRKNVSRKKSDSTIETVFKTPQAKTVNSHCRTEIKKVSYKSTCKKYGFIESLSSCIPDEQRHPDAIEFCKKFSNKKIKDELLKKVYQLFNETVFDGKLPENMKLQWNNRLTSTAGMCKYKTEEGKPVAEIHISTKVCDIAERLRDTCVHEMCHAAVYLFNGSKHEGHGRLWQYWAHKVTEVFKDIPKVSTSHNYAITKKFVYKCVDCGQEIQRFQKSIDMEKNLCGRCHGRFILLQNDKKLKEKQKNAINDKLIFGGTSSNDDLVSAALMQTPRKLNAFAQFVKENYNSVKAENKLSSHKDVMQEISKKFKQLSTK